MKKMVYLFVVLLSVTAMFSCSSEDNDNGQWDPNAMIRINAVSSVSGSRAGNDSVPTPWYVSRYGSEVNFTDTLYHIKVSGIRFSGASRDTSYDHPAIKMFASKIISQEGKLDSAFLMFPDIVIVQMIAYDRNGIKHVMDPTINDGTFLNDNDYYLWDHQKPDTIAYIPESVRKEALELTTKYYYEGNYTKVYEIFNKAYECVPITGAQYRKLKAEGKE